MKILEVQNIFHCNIENNLLDTPLRRIFPLWFLHDALRGRQLTLVSPKLWEDPHEDPASHCQLEYKPNPSNGDFGSSVPLETYLASAWGQCWSLNPGSDTLLRAYSRVSIDTVTKRNTEPKFEGVSVTTTPRHLITAMQYWKRQHPEDNFVIGCVKYLSEKEIGQKLCDEVNSKSGPEIFKTIKERAKSLMLKREYFHHEQEVRILCIKHENGIDNTQIRKFQFNPNDIFTSISFDPRLISHERLERQAEVKRLGYNGELIHDPIYIENKITLKIISQVQ